jgi:hypothetical protein
MPQTSTKILLHTLASNPHTFTATICQLLLCINIHATFNTRCTVMLSSSRNTLGLFWRKSNPAIHPTEHQKLQQCCGDCQESDTLTEITSHTHVVTLHVEIKTPGSFKVLLRSPHTLRFDLRIACAVSKRKVRWSRMTDTDVPSHCPFFSQLWLSRAWICCLRSFRFVLR